MTSLRFDFGSTSVQPQKPLTSPFYGSLNDPGFKTMILICLTHIISLGQDMILLVLAYQIQFNLFFHKFRNILIHTHFYL